MDDTPISVPVLKALSPQAVQALQGGNEVPLTVWPFRIGRESRADAELSNAEIMERRARNVAPTNELYLLDEAFVKFVSREHFQIERVTDGDYQLRDCGSACGVMVDDKWIGGDRRGGVSPLRDGQTLRVGGPDAPYDYLFCAPVIPDQE